MKRLTIVILCMLVATLSAQAQSDEELPKNSKEWKALRELAQTDLHAQYLVAYCYLTGIKGVVAQQHEKGKSILRKAADAGSPDACRVMYKMDPQKYYSYRQRAEQLYTEDGGGEACYYMAELLVDDKRTCQRWLKTSLIKGYRRAQTALESIYNNDWSGSSTSFENWVNGILAIGETDNTEIQLEKPKAEIKYLSEVDLNLPEDTLRKNVNTIALVVGNENYKSVPPVTFALNDASMFAEYCKRVLGLPDQNVVYLPDATYGSLVGTMADIKYLATTFPDSTLNIIFYYAGHGVPNEKTKDAYLMPVDADPQRTNICYSIGKLISDLASTKARSIVLFIDACFSGALRGEGVLAENRGVAIKVKDTVPKGNMVMFSSAMGDETAWPYKEKGHGTFTYFLLKKLQQSNGEASLDELSDYLLMNVRRQSALNLKRQTPSIVPAIELGEEWRNWKMK
ncbi:caspase family protein [Prevotella sp. P6B1]|uniref:caspase family protein n=1 Tax=Prevotella sp. P6B1 TaxID=1410613 RepID=UPI0009DFEF48|nr:caspase family protein [Prevotella sp. P6B1]